MTENATDTDINSVDEESDIPMEDKSSYRDGRPR